jgi:hypothetical protein
MAANSSSNGLSQRMRPSFPVMPHNKQKKPLNLLKARDRGLIEMLFYYSMYTRR